jgi:hypothetical protein
VMPHLAFHTNPLSLPSGQDPLAFDKACEGAKNVALDRRGRVRTGHIAPKSDRESGHAAMVMSALPLKADICGATSDVG